MNCILNSWWWTGRMFILRRIGTIICGRTPWYANHRSWRLKCFVITHLPLKIIAAMAGIHKTFTYVLACLGGFIVTKATIVRTTTIISATLNEINGWTGKLHLQCQKQSFATQNQKRRQWVFTVYSHHDIQQTYSMSQMVPRLCTSEMFNSSYEARLIHLIAFFSCVYSYMLPQVVP